MSFTFNGTNQNLTATSSPLGNNPTSFTMACFVKGSPATAICVFGMGSSGSTAPAIACFSGSGGAQPTSNFVPFVRNDANVNLVGSSGDATSAAGVAFDGSWHHISMTLESTSFNAYVDGVLGVTKTGVIGALSTNRLSVGSLLRTTASGYFNGDVAEPAVWNVALTSAEIASLSKGMTPDKVRPQNLVFYAPIVRNLIDIEGGLTLTNNNSATVSTHPRIYS